MRESISFKTGSPAHTHSGVLPAISQIRLMAEIMSRPAGAGKSGLVDEAQHVRQGADGLVLVHSGPPTGAE
jgi:hypothetical protein